MDFIKQKKVYIPGIIVLALIGGYLFQSGKGRSAAATAEVKRGDLVQEVTVSGKVLATEAVLLAFEKSGRIRRINALVGASVTEGDVLLALENGVEISALEDAEAKLSSKQAHYDDLKAGGRPEEVRVKETELAKAKSDLATNYAEVEYVVLDALNKADNAVHARADILFSNTLSSNPQLSFVSRDQQAAFDAQSERVSVESALNDFKKLSESGFPTESGKENVLVQSKNYLLTINSFLGKTSRALNAASNLSDSVLATDKDALNTARTNISTALSNITDQTQTIATQKITVEKAADELSLTKSGATTEVLAGALADVSSAEANVKNAKAVLVKTYILSPLSGVITKQDGKVGEIAAANASLVAVMSNRFKIEAFVPEVDLAKIKLGNTAEVTLDAYGSDVAWNARVVKIDPAETVIDGVSTYKTTLEFEKPDERIRSGLTANITLATARRENALSVPERAVFQKNGKKFVRVLKSDTKEEREVSTGLKGSNGELEIVSGLAEGEHVVAASKEK